MGDWRWIRRIQVVRGRAAFGTAVRRCRTGSRANVPGIIVGRRVMGFRRSHIRGSAGDCNARRIRTSDIVRGRSVASIGGLSRTMLQRAQRTPRRAANTVSETPSCLIGVRKLQIPVVRGASRQEGRSASCGSDTGRKALHWVEQPRTRAPSALMSARGNRPYPAPGMIRTRNRKGCEQREGRQSRGRWPQSAGAARLAAIGLFLRDLP
jgi:hypothetical protein